MGNELSQSISFVIRMTVGVPIAIAAAIGGQALGWAYLLIVGELTFVFLPIAAFLMDVPRIAKNAFMEQWNGTPPPPGRSNAWRLGKAIGIIKYIWQVLEDMIFEAASLDRKIEAAQENRDRTYESMS